MKLQFCDNYTEHKIFTYASNIKALMRLFFCKIPPHYGPVFF